MGRPGAGRRVLQAVHGLLTSAEVHSEDLVRIVVGVGPGGFTGLRIGIATALGLGQALDIPVTGASSLEALGHDMAMGRAAGAVVVPALDGRRKEVFVGAYEVNAEGGLEELLSPRALGYAEAAELLAAVGSPERPATVAGEGVLAAADAWEVPHLVPMPAISGPMGVRAAALVCRVEAGAARPATPDYARLPDAEINRRRALATAGEGESA